MEKEITPNDIPPSLLERMRKKGLNVSNNYKVVVAAFTKRGNCLGIVSNSYRKDNITPARFSGYHSEMKALHKWGPAVDTLVLMRVGRSGEIRPIDCCPKCAAVLKKCGVKVLKLQTDRK